MLIFLWVQYELSYDRYHEKADQICQVFQTYLLEKGTHTSEGTPGPLARGLQKKFPEIINTSRMGKIGEVLLKFIPLGEDNNVKPFLETEGMYADPSIFEIFSFPFIKGNPKTALGEPHSIFLTKTIAEKIFGNEEPLGRVIRIRNRFDLVVTGVIKDIPFNSHRRFQFLLPFIIQREMGENIESYGNNSFFTYVMLPRDTPYQEVSRKISHYLDDVVEYKAELSLMPFVKVHLEEHDGIGYGLLTIFSFLAFIIIITACINFMNLSTARSVHRAKEVGIRKVIGASRIQLVKQFIGEAILLTVISFFIAIVLIECFLPAFSLLTGKHVTTNYIDIQFIFGSLGIILFTGIVAGTYPAFFLSSFQPVKVLKESLKGGEKGGRLRKVLVVVQFSFAIFFIVGSTVLIMQMNHIKRGDLGFKRENIIYIPVKGDIWNKYESIKNELLHNPNVTQVTTSSHMPFLINDGELDWGTRENDRSIIVWHTKVGYDYIKLFNMEMIQGRFFSKEFPTDGTQSVVVNDKAIKTLEFESPIGKRLWFLGKYYTIIGVVKDFHSFPLALGGSEALVMRLNPVNKFMFVKIRVKNPDPIKSGQDDSGRVISNTVRDLGGIFNKYNLDYPFEFNFLDEYIDKEGKAFLTVIQIITSLTILSIFISCLGLFGLSSFMTEQRTKEIGIRKVLGASVKKIIQLLSKEYFKLLVIANLIACPIAYLALNKMLQFLTSRISLSIWIFLATSMFVCVLALLTVGFQALRAATKNPVESMRYE